VTVWLRRHKKSQERARDRIDREIHLTGELDTEQRARLLAIADRCPVHRVLQTEVEIETRLAAVGASPGASFAAPSEAG
jgi:putative redox protein